MIQGISYAALSPVLFTGVAALVVLLADAFGLRRAVVGSLSAVGLLGGLASVLVLSAGERRATFCVPAGLRGSGPPACSYVADDFTLLFQGVILAAALIVLLLSLPEIVRSSLPAGEFHFLLLCAVSGALTLVAARDLVTLVVSLETLTLPVFALVALDRYDGAATEAAVKFFLISVISTAVMLFGVSLVYGVTGSLYLDRMSAAPPGLGQVMSAGIVLVLAGFAFKVAAVPFQFWAPDVYQGAPLPVAAFLSVISKAAGFAGLLIVLARGFPAYGHIWGPILAAVAALTMTLGNLVALRQTLAIRLLAWSSVAQSGYMLAPLAVGSRALGAAVQATTTYVILYAIMNAGAFAVVCTVRTRPLSSYQGLARSHPFQATALAFFLLCLAGLPPGVMGLYAKIVVFRATVTGNVTWLAALMAVNTVLGLSYYLPWAARLFQPTPTPAPQTSTAAPRRELSTGLAMALTTAIAIALSFAPQALLEAISHIT